VLVYVDENRIMHTFVCNDTGHIADFPRGDKRNDWGDIMKIHIPDGFDKTLAEMTENEFQLYEQKICAKEHYSQFAKWLLTKCKKQ